MDSIILLSKDWHKALCISDQLSQKKQLPVGKCALVNVLLLFENYSTTKYYYGCII